MIIFYLFDISKDLNGFFQKRMDSAIKEIQATNKDYILNVNIPDYTKYLIEKYELKTPILHEDKITSDYEEINVDRARNPSRLSRYSCGPRYVTGTRVTLYIPFEGDVDLFTYRPSTFSTGISLEATLNNQELLIYFEGVSDPHEYVKAEFERQLKGIEKYLGWVEKDVRGFNSNLAQKIKLKIEERRNKILKDGNLISSLGFPLRIRDGMPTTYAVPIERKKIVPQPTPSTDNFVQESILSFEDYENILSIVHNMSLVMERSPKAFKEMDEEALRQHFLVQLNGQYEGQATGETFNFQGKTDILIRNKEKNIFIAECKFWKGESVLTETIDQILKYLSWRDTKTAIFIFNKNKNLSNVLTQIPEIVKKHPNFKREVKYVSETGFRFILRHNEDSNRELILTVLVFDVPN